MNLKPKARNLRKTSTPAERHLWHHLRARRLSYYKFKRQTPFGPYIVDFICHRKKLIIELDGSQHLESQSYDQTRTHYLNARGYKVLRFWNNEVLTNLEAVLSVILYELETS